MQACRAAVAAAGRRCKAFPAASVVFVVLAAGAAPGLVAPRATAAESSEPTTLTAAVEPGVVVYGGSARLTGRLESGGGGVAGAALTVSWSTDGVTWSELSAVVTADNGDYSLPVTPDPALGSVRYRVSFAGDAARDPAEAQISLGVRAGLTKPSAPRTVGRATAFTTSGTLRPRSDPASATVTIHCYRYESRRWVQRAKFTATLSNGSTGASQYRAGVKLPSAGTWRLCAYYQGTAGRSQGVQSAAHSAEAGLVSAGADPVPVYAATLSSPGASFTVTAKADLPVWDRDGSTSVPERMKSRLNARQLVVITGSRLGARTGTLRVYDYRSGDWVRRMSVPVRFGTYGLTNGLTRRAGNRTTPTGIWRMATYAFGRHAHAPSGTKLRWRRITNRSWWSSERNSTYNTWVETSRRVYGEHLADYPRSYEFAISSGYNALPNSRVYGRGSGIFVHVIHPGYSAGCIMLSRSNMIRLLRLLDPAKKPACAIGTTRAGTTTSIWAY